MREHVPGHVAGMGVYKLVGEEAAKKARGDQWEEEIEFKPSNFGGIIAFK